MDGLLPENCYSDDQLNEQLVEEEDSQEEPISVLEGEKGSVCKLNVRRCCEMFHRL